VLFDVATGLIQGDLIAPDIAAILQQRSQQRATRVQNLTMELYRVLQKLQDLAREQAADAAAWDEYTATGTISDHLLPTDERDVPKYPTREDLRRQETTAVLDQRADDAKFAAELDRAIAGTSWARNVGLKRLADGTLTATLVSSAPPTRPTGLRFKEALTVTVPRLLRAAVVAAIAAGELPPSPTSAAPVDPLPAEVSEMLTATASVGMAKSVSSDVAPVACASDPSDVPAQGALFSDVEPGKPP
jgi:hypothetical protein